MKNLSRNILILTLILMALSIGLPALAADSGKSPNTGSALDEWDDDVWSDWGAKPVTKGGAPENEYKDDNELPKDPVGGAAASVGGSLDGSSSFGESKDKLRFNLVRDGFAQGPKGVRKYRPSYRRKTL